MGATRELAACIHRLDYASLPRDVVEKARLCLTDWVAVAAAGYVQGEHDFDEMHAALSPCFGAPHAVLVGKQQRLDVLHAALFNGAAALLGPVLGEARAQELLRWLATLEDTEDVAQLAALMH